MNDKQSLQEYIDEIGLEMRAEEIMLARRSRPAINQAYVETISSNVLTSIMDDLKQGKNKKKMARRYAIPYNIIVYIWEHHL